ncbi:MAG: glycosyltransferase family 4 protein [Prevotellaceae bacterium]|jgi:glycosyltransferase involved in cell wall biosynthesis|nr:glycosyltransferase family 4 protein [Prevotellaceae bacterium]
MKKILYICSEYSPGMIPYGANIVNTMKGENVYAIFVSKGKHNYHNIVEKNDRYTFIEMPKGKLGALLFKLFPIKLILSIKKVCKKEKIDIVHYLTGEFILALYTKFSRKKYDLYYTVHDLTPHQVEKKKFFDSLIDKYIRWGVKSNRETIKNITTNSLQQIDTLKTMYPEKKIVFTHFPSLITKGIEEGNDCPEEILGISNYILFFGFVDAYKGVDLLIQAYKQLTDKKNHQLVIAGKGIEYTDSEAGIIRINRFIHDSEIKMLFEKANCVVYPYRSATMSGVLSLAYYFNKKILVSAVPFFLENIDKNETLTFEPGNVEDLSKKLEAVLKKEHRNNASFYDRNYSKKTLMNDYFKLYGL